MKWHRALIVGFLLCGVMVGIGQSQELPDIPQALHSAIVRQSEEDWTLRKRISSVLPALRKTLILEQTRGIHDVVLYRGRAPAVVLIVTNQGYGSGTVIDAQGHVLTNWHVVAGYSQVPVVFKPKKGEDLKKELVRTATVERIDKTLDLALLKIVAPPKPLVFARLGKSSQLEVGQDVFAIGHPMGEIWTFTKGIISQIRPEYEWGDAAARHRATVIQTQTPINPGNSGGPLLDEGGRLIGVNSFTKPNTPGLNYAIAVDSVERFLESPSPSQVKAPPLSPQSQPDQLHCPESYDSGYRGWKNIAGCYYQKSATPPPDMWVVSRDAQGLKKYLVLGSKSKSQLDTLVETSTLNKNELIWQLDTNCNGLVDLLGYQPEGSSKIERYAYPSDPVFLRVKGNDLHDAITDRQLPYPSVRFCP